MTVDDALAFFGGSNTKLADAIGISPAAVSNWKQRGFIPYDAQCRLQIATKGRLKADPLQKTG